MSKKFINLLVVLGIALMPGLAMAENLGQVASDMSTSFQGIGNLVGTIAYVMGIVMAAVAVYQFKQHKDNEQQMPLSKPIVGMIVAALLLFLPETINTVKDSVWVNGASSQGSSGQFTIN